VRYFGGCEETEMNILGCVFSLTQIFFVSVRYFHGQETNTAASSPGFGLRTCAALLRLPWPHTLYPHRVYKSMADPNSIEGKLHACISALLREEFPFTQTSIINEATDTGVESALKRAKYL